MNIKNTLLASLCLGLGACASDTSTSRSDTSGTGSSYGGSAGTSSGASGSSAGTSGSGSTTGGSGMTGASGMMGASGSAASQSWIGTVQSIEPMTRQDAGIGIGSAGAAAAGGTLGTQGAPTDRVYRVTLRLEDGTSQMVTVDTQPTYATGDRVRYSNGMLQKEQ